MYDHILVPIDGSDTAAHGLGEAMRLAKALGSRLRIVHVVNKAPVIAPSLAGSTLDDVVQQLLDKGQALLDDNAAQIRAAGFEIDERLIEVFGERVGEAIVAEAKAWPAHLIVCGTHGRRGVRRLLLGSDAEHIVRDSPVPVLLVRAPAA